MRSPLKSRFLIQLGWLVAIWTVSVLALGIFAAGLRMLMSAVGMTPS